MIAFVAIVIGLFLGTASGGSIRGIETVRLRFEWPVLVLFVGQAVARGRIAGVTASSLGFAVWVLSCIALIAFLAPDWLQPGVWVAGLGLALNVFVVLLNGGMPVALAGRTVVPVVQSAGFYQLVGTGTLMSVLGDVIPLTIGGYRILASPGDVLLALGVAIIVVAGMLNHHDGLDGATFAE